MKREVNRNKKNILEGFFYLVIIFLFGKAIIKAEMPNIVNDEFGYWLSAAFFSGKKWNSVAQGIAYYGYGYGVILSIIMRLCSNYIFVYKCAIALNALWLCLSFHFLIKISNYIWPNQKNIYYYLMSLFVILNPYNVCLSNYTLPENFLFFIYILITWNFFFSMQKGRKWSYLLLALEINYVYVVHQRTVILFFTITVMLIWKLAKKKEYSKILIYLVALILTFAVLCFVKKHVLLGVWCDSNITNGNDYLGQKDKLFAICSMTGLISLLRNICGRVVYVVVSTYGMICVVLYKLLRDLIGFFKKKKEINMFNTYVIINVLFAIVISAVFLLFPDHTTHIFYGRYMENYYGPLILMGCGEILFEYNFKINKKYLCIFTIVIIGMVLGVKVLCEFDSIKIENYAINSSSISWMYLGKENLYYILGIVLFIIMLLLLCTNFIKHKCVITGLYFSILFFQILIGEEAYDSFQKRYYDNLVDSTKEVCSIVQDINVKMKNIYKIIVTDDGAGVFCAGAPIQYVLMDNTVYYYENITEKEFEDRCILISAGNIEKVIGMKKVKKCNLFSIWIPAESVELNNYFTEE